MKGDVQGLINLNNQNNLWYREQEKIITRMKEQINHIAEDVKEIKEVLRERGH